MEGPGCFCYGSDGIRALRPTQFRILDKDRWAEESAPTQLQRVFRSGRGTPYGEVEGAPLKGRTEFAARRRQKIQIIFHRGMYVGKHSSHARISGILPLAAKLCVRQTWGLLAEKSEIFRQRR